MSAADTKKYLKSAVSLTSDGRTVVQNTPEEYGGRQRQYLSRRTQEFVAKRAYLSSDFIEAEVQGLTDDFYEWTTIKIRMSDISTLNQTAITSKKIDDYKEVLIPDLGIDYLPIGAKIKAMGSTWLAVNPSNIASVNATTIVARCNTSFNYYDEYGNIQTEPIVLEKTSMLGNRNESPLELVLMTGYFTVACQLNEATAKMSENSRIILGKKAYSITGYTDFIQEFSGDYDSCHICTFTARVEEPTELDDIPNRIADGKSQSFKAEINGSNVLQIGRSEHLEAAFIKDGTESHLPASWEWSSDSENAVVDENGNIEGFSEGKAVITATLRENPNIKASLSIDVISASAQNHVSFEGFPKKAIGQYSFGFFKAVYHGSDGEVTDDVEWTFSGASPENYAIIVANDDITGADIDFDGSDGDISLVLNKDDYNGSLLDIEGNTLFQIYGEDATRLVLVRKNTLVGFENGLYVYCISASDVPLVITASYNGYQKSVTVDLEGY